MAWRCKKCGSTEILLEYTGHIRGAYNKDGELDVFNEQFGDGVDFVWAKCNHCWKKGASVKDVAVWEDD